jgi:hypothetical protein
MISKTRLEVTLRKLGLVVCRIHRLRSVVVGCKVDKLEARRHFIELWQISVSSKVR